MTKKRKSKANGRTYDFPSVAETVRLSIRLTLRLYNAKDC
jgi:hypothetical protein